MYIILTIYAIRLYLVYLIMCHNGLVICVHVFLLISLSYYSCHCVYTCNIQPKRDDTLKWINALLKAPTGRVKCKRVVTWPGQPHHKAETYCCRRKPSNIVVPVLTYGHTTSVALSTLKQNGIGAGSYNEKVSFMFFTTVYDVKAKHDLLSVLVILQRSFCFK